ncbi:monooxygenase 2-like [Pistacia vera]|uniref:monooxygenase 2-like n=1 Tax=Pistacia vera TaxID=55513 RepID=UPI001262F3A0|nr:monooxygenase 2-like [Pistacia vera]
MEMVEDVVIVGAGIAGLATAVALKRVGVRAMVLERADGLRATGSALTLFPNAWLALDALGVSHKLTSLYSPFKKGRTINIDTGIDQRFPLRGIMNDQEHGPRSVHRKTLLKALADELPAETIRFCSKLAAIQTEEQEGSTIVILRMEDGTIIKTKILIGCDGVHSMVARWLGLAEAANSGRSAARGLAVFPEGHGLEPEVQQLKHMDKRGGIIPIDDKEVYWYLTCTSPPKGAEMPRNSELILKEVSENYARNFPQHYLEIIQHSDLSTVTWAPLMFRYPWKIILGNLSKGNITVAGDAMHPMTPDFGQGGCAALEDAVVLGRFIGNSIIANRRLVPENLAPALGGYAQERRWRAAWLITGSYTLWWVQQSELKWWMKFFRTAVSILISILSLRNANFNCGNLPTGSCDKSGGNSLKIH